MNRWGTKVCRWTDGAHRGTDWHRQTDGQMRSEDGQAGVQTDSWVYRGAK